MEFRIERMNLDKQQVLDLDNPQGTLSVRRNPPRKAKLKTPAAKHPQTSRASRPSRAAAVDERFTPLPAGEIIEAESLPHHRTTTKPSETNTESPDNLKVFLRIRPLEIRVKPSRKPYKGNGKPGAKGASPNGGGKSRSGNKNGVCLFVNDSRSVTLEAPPSSPDSKRSRSEVFDGFGYVFSAESQQKDVYERVLEPLVVDFLEGKSGLLAAMGPTGSGKTHTMFGSPKEPGIVHLALEQIFCHENLTIVPHKLRSYYLSMFEIYSDRGKGERVFDLSAGEADLSLPQSAINCLQEVIISNIAEAECIIARGMLKRMTAVTKANRQSSRSQCVISIRCEPKSIQVEGEIPNGSVLTIVDLAGAERERKTGNQGARLLESNFINKTSMVFGLCLRSLLEHQKNPRRPLQKHFQSSLLTRYLRDYLEGKKRMALILTVKPGEEDYLDSSFLLRQASPYMNIKFNNVEELRNASCQKRHNFPLMKLENPKRRKCAGDSVIFPVVGTTSCKDGCPASEKEKVIPVQHQESEPLPISSDIPELSNAISETMLLDKLERISRNNQVLQSFSKALWNVLKQYKKKLVVLENSAENLRRKLQEDEAQSLELKERLEDFMSHCHSCCRHCLHPDTSHTKLDTSSELCTTALTSTLKAGIEPEDFKSVHINDPSEVPTTWRPQSYKEEGTGDTLSDPITSPSLSDVLVSNDDRTVVSPMDTELIREDEKSLQVVRASPVEAAGPSGRCEAIKLPGKENCISAPKMPNFQKPRRRLLPVSGMLLKELNGFDVEMENPKGNKCYEAQEVTEQKGRSQGSISLFRLLKTNPH